MSRIAKSDVHFALTRAAEHLKSAAGADQQLSAQDIDAKVASLEGTEQRLVDMFAAFVKRRETGGCVTHADVDRALEWAKKEMVDDYDLNSNGLSRAEIAEMSTTAKLAVKLAVEIKAEPGFNWGAFVQTVHAAAGDYSFTSESDSKVIPFVLSGSERKPVTADSIRELLTPAHHAALHKSAEGWGDEAPFDIANAQAEELSLEDLFAGETIESLRAYSDFFPEAANLSGADLKDLAERLSTPPAGVADVRAWRAETVEATYAALGKDLSGTDAGTIAAIALDIADKNRSAFQEIALRDVLEASLDDVKAFRMFDAEPNADAPGAVGGYFAMGKAPNGELAGVYVAAAET